ncbi:ankyrin repeat domain-containing protein [Pseudomonas sp. Irchel 3A7]|uniref:ankyrin repeat domain-containing protein n=1 Tax=Pseudomonas sp. Irchel 3A7 TaxID=2008913 RepID=UPI00114020FE|nr:ankyrin repeat domain-containing protein [Pseudomonas sp. Irchel 3A7]
MVLQYSHSSYNLTGNEQAALLKLNAGDDRAEVYGLRLIACTKYGNAEAARFLLAHGADINCQDKYGMTALHYAAATSYRPCIRLLTSFNECSYLLQDYKGRYASELAYEWGKDYVVGELLTKKQARQAYAQGVPAFVKA